MIPASASGRRIWLVHLVSDAVKIAGKPVVTVGKAVKRIAADKIACHIGRGPNLFGFPAVLFRLTRNCLVHGNCGATKNGWHNYSHNMGE